jgi:hypothetical protein
VDVGEKMQRRRDQRTAERMRFSKPPGTREIMAGLGSKRQTPAEVFADRDRRLNAARTPNMAVLGDPVVPRWNSNATRRWAHGQRDRHE